MRRSMLLSLVSLPALILAAGALVPDAEGQVAIQPVPFNLCNSIQREPVLSYDTSGGTLLGPFNVNVQVFNNGEIKYSRSIGLLPDVAVVHASAPIAAVKQLRNDLQAAGAFTLCDQAMFISDVPLNTVTVYRGNMNGNFHTFNFWIGGGSNAYGNVLQIINEFVTTHVPGA